MRGENLKIEMVRVRRKIVPGLVLIFELERLLYSHSVFICPPRQEVVTRRIREKMYSLEKIIRAKRPLSETEIKFLISKVRIKGLSWDDIRERFFIFKQETISLNKTAVDDFVGSPEFNKMSYPFVNIGSNESSFRDFLFAVRDAGRWQMRFPEVLDERKFGTLGIIIALAEGIFYISDNGKFHIPDSSASKEKLIRLLILGNLFISGPERVDAEYSGLYYRVIDKENMMVAALENGGLSHSGRSYIVKIYQRKSQDEVWIEWNLVNDTAEILADNDEQARFLTGLVKRRP